MPFALPALFVDPVLAAAAAAIIIAGILLAQMIGNLLGTINIGPVSIPIGRWFLNIAHSVESWALNAFNHLLAPLGAWLNAIAFDAYHSLAVTVDAVTHLGDQIAHVVTSTIPDAIAHQFAHIMGILDSDLGKVYDRIRAAEHTLQGDITTQAGHTFAHLAGIIDHDIGAVHTYVNEHVAAAEHAASNALSAAEGTLTRDIHSAIQTAEAAAAAAEAALSKDLGGAIAAAEAAAAAAAGYLQGEINSSTAAITAAAATAAAAVSAVKALASEFDSCAVTKCAGPNNLGKLLNDLLVGVSYAELAAFVSLAIGRPAAAAGEFAGVAHGLYTDADQLLTTLLAI